MDSLNLMCIHYDENNSMIYSGTKRTERESVLRPILKVLWPLFLTAILFRSLDGALNFINPKILR